MDPKEFARLVEEYFERLFTHGFSRDEREDVIKRELREHLQHLDILLKLGLPWIKRAKSWREFSMGMHCVITNPVQQTFSTKDLSAILKRNKGYVKMVLNFMKMFKWPVSPSDEGPATRQLGFFVKCYKTVEVEHTVEVPRKFLSFLKKTVIEKRGQRVLRSRKEIILDLEILLAS